MSEETQTAPVNGSCARCGCPLGYSASREEAVWYCCGACAGSDRCHCGCKPEYAREPVGDVYVPTRRMFAARSPDGLKRNDHADDRDRAFPFADKERGS
jgi:hypothetical protein